MSTFDGVIAEFPDIRIDRFPRDKERPALAHFLSHVHSDHLRGLEFVNKVPLYCSPATRELLLRLEKYPNRMNFAKGILEARLQTYKHLKNLLRPIPLETPTEIELTPGNEIRVTLFDANHCVGAVMFLIEGGGKAILYTGDIRSEQWWVQSLCRQPLLIPYVCIGKSEPLRRLNNIYLDTTFASKNDRYRQFPSKAEGIRELLDKIKQYPRDTEFYFDAWTFGYEDVWQTLSAFLESQVHVDDYRYKLYQGLHSGVEPKAVEAYKLIGSRCGNHNQSGCLANSYCRLHSCEKGTGCEIWSKDFVRITPVISRYQGVDMAELGAGGGHGDLNQQHEIDLSEGLFELVALCAQKLSTQPQLLESLLKMLNDASKDERHAISVELSDISIETALHGESQDRPEPIELDELPIDRLVPLLAKRVTKLKQTLSDGRAKQLSRTDVRAKDGLPKRIMFPYSRHSSYGELHMLIEAFKPDDISPCTVDEVNWDTEQSMWHLFGGLYDKPRSFKHDQMMLRKRNDIVESPQSPREDYEPESQETQKSYNADITPARAPRGTPQFFPQLTRQTSPSKQSSDEYEADGRKRRRLSTHGDYWPPQEADHYSPERASASRDVLIGNLRRDVTESGIRRFFGPFNVHDIRLATHKREPLAFVTFETSAEAQRAVQELHEQPLNGQRVRLERARTAKRGGRRSPSPTLPDQSWKQPTEITYERFSPKDQRFQWEQRIRGTATPTIEAHDAAAEEMVPSSREPSAHITSKKGPSDRRQTSDYGRLSPPPQQDFVGLTGDELKEALQRDAYDAVLSGGNGWCLVSVDGHQVKDEEL